MKNASIWRKCHLIIYLFLTSKLRIGRWKLGIIVACGDLHFAFQPHSNREIEISKISKTEFLARRLGPFLKFHVSQHLLALEFSKGTALHTNINQSIKINYMSKRLSKNVTNREKLIAKINQMYTRLCG